MVVGHTWHHPAKPALREWGEVTRTLSLPSLNTHRFPQEVGLGQRVHVKLGCPALWVPCFLFALLVAFWKRCGVSAIDSVTDPHIPRGCWFSHSWVIWNSARLSAPVGQGPYLIPCLPPPPLTGTQAQCFLSTWMKMSEWISQSDRIKIPEYDCSKTLPVSTQTTGCTASKSKTQKWHRASKADRYGHWILDLEF